MTQDDLRVTQKHQGVLNTVWDGTKVKLRGAGNETVEFNLVLEAPSGAYGVPVSFNQTDRAWRRDHFVRPRGWRPVVQSFPSAT